MNHHRKLIFDSIINASRYFNPSSVPLKHNTSLSLVLPFSVPSRFRHQHSTQYVKSIVREDDLKFEGNPNHFGSLSKNDLDLERAAESMPEEEGDVLRINFVDNIVNKRYLRTKQYADMIKDHLKNKRLNEALDVLNVTMLKEHKAKPENYIYNLLIDGCAQLGYTKQAFVLFNQMKKRGLRPTGATYTSLFDACARSPVPGDGLKRATNLRRLIEEKAVLLNTTNYHAMIKAFGRCGDIVSAFSLVDEMISKRIRPTSETFAFLLQACAADSTHGFKHALIVLKKMREKRVAPTLFTYNLLLRCTRDCGTGELIPVPPRNANYNSPLSEADTIDLIELRRSDGMTEVSPKVNIQTLQQLPDDALSLSEILGSLSTFLDKPKHRLVVLGGVPGLLKQMDLDGVCPDIKTFTLLLAIIPSTISAELDLIDEMKKRKLAADIDFYNALIRKRALRKDYRAGKDVYGMIEELGLKPNLMTYGVLSLCCRSSKDANQFLSLISSAGFRPNIEILGGLMCAAKHSWNPGLMCHILDIVQEESLPPTDIFVDHVQSFISYVDHQLQLKECGKDYHPTLNNQRIMKSFDSLKTKFSAWKKFNEVSPLPHPWAQFNRTKSAEAAPND